MFKSTVKKFLNKKNKKPTFQHCISYLLSYLVLYKFLVTLQINDCNACFPNFYFFLSEVETVNRKSATFFSNQGSCRTDLKIPVRIGFIFHKVAITCLIGQIFEKKQCYGADKTQIHLK